jgi:hypothetical protein
MKELPNAKLADTLILGANITRPPLSITRDNYLLWLQTFKPDNGGGEISGFFDLIFDWYESQMTVPLPDQVRQAKDKLYVTINDALKQTLALEQSGDISEYTTVGFEAYGIAPVPLDFAIKTALYYCGRPIGQIEGETTPRPESRFSKAVCTIRKMEEGRDRGNYFSTNSQLNGGVVEDLNDEYALLVRDNASHGVTLFGSFLQPMAGKETMTSQGMYIMTLKPLSDSQTDFRLTLRRNGQTYSVWGNGRYECGFNQKAFLDRQKQFLAGMVSLYNNGKIGDMF